MRIYWFHIEVSHSNTNFHCYKTIQVLAGVHEINPANSNDNDAERDDLNVGKAILHKDYEIKQPGQSQVANHDLAILELEETIVFTLTEKIRPICLPSGSLEYKDSRATTAGWGWTDGRVIPPSLFNNTLMLPLHKVLIPTPPQTIYRS